MRRVMAIIALILPIIAAAQTMPMHHAGSSISAMPTQSGQAAFAAIQEVVAILEADPKTDWTKVDIEALRQHLIDMDNVTLHAEVKSAPTEGGVIFTVSGTGTVRSSIQRMVLAHAATMNGVGGWRFVAGTMDAGATLAVNAPGPDAPMLTALGFIGILTRGMHHQAHHLMIARGANPLH